MTFKIEDFQATVAQGQGLAQTNMYRVSLPIINEGGGETASAMNLLCKATVLPGKTMMTTQRQIGINKENIANGYAIEDVSMSFYVLNDMKVRKYFEEWIESTVNQETYEIGYYNEYVRDIKIDVFRKGKSFPLYNKQLTALRKIPSAIRNVLPKIGPINLRDAEIDLDIVTPDELIYTCSLIEAYPVAMGAINLTGEQNELMEVNVTFTYRNWKGEFYDTSKYKPEIVSN